MNKLLGRTITAAGALAGAYIGGSLGEQANNSQIDKVPGHELAVANAQTNLDDAIIYANDYLSTLPEPCEEDIRTFLSGGANSDYSNETAALLAQTNCAQDIGAVAIARDNESAILEKEDVLWQKKDILGEAAWAADTKDEVVTLMVLVGLVGALTSRLGIVLARKWRHRREEAKSTEMLETALGVPSNYSRL